MAEFTAEHMSSVRIGQIAPFPPLPGQPYPPARNHPRWKELYRLNDEWMMKYWPFSSEKKRARIPFMNLAGFSTWCAPAADFDRMVWGGRMASIFFLADDYIDSGRMLDRIPGFKKAATGTGPEHPEDRAELCHDIVFRAIKATSHPRTFDQLTKCTHEWWDSNIHEPFQNLDQYLATRRVNIAMYFANSYFRYTLDINLTDEQVNHPLMREAEGVVSDHVGLTNDFFSYVKEKLTNSDDTNIIRILQDHEGLTYEQAKIVIEKKIRQKEQDFIPAGMAVLNDPELGSDPEVRRWIANLPYCMGGNNAWSQESGRYNVGDVPGGLPFPSLSFEAESTPDIDVIDDTEESRLRDLVFNIKDIPPPDFTLDVDAIEDASQKTVTYSALQPANLIDFKARPRPENIGILAIEASTSSHNDESEAAAIASNTFSTLLRKYNVEKHTIGRIDIGTEYSSEVLKLIKSSLLEFFQETENIEIFSRDGQAAALFDSVSWIDGSSWSGQFAIVYAGDVAMLIGPNAPLIVEPLRGQCIDQVGISHRDANQISEDVHQDQAYLAALEKSYSSYQRKSIIGTGEAYPKRDPSKEFQYMIYSTSDSRLMQLGHARMVAKHLISKDIDSGNSTRDFSERVAPSLSLSRGQGESLYLKLASIIAAVPCYDLFESRISLFDYAVDGSGSFFAIRVKGDTKLIRDTMGLSSAATVDVVKCEQSKVDQPRLSLLLRSIREILPKYLI